MKPGNERLFQLCAPSAGNASPEFTSCFGEFHLWSEPALSTFDFPLCASKPGCELSKAASKAVVRTRRGRSKPPRSWAAAAEKDGGWAESKVVSEAIGMQVVMRIDKATHVRERQSGAFAGGGHDRYMMCEGGGAGRSLHRNIIKPCVCVCECVSGAISTLQLNDKARPAVSLPLSPTTSG